MGYVNYVDGVKVGGFDMFYEGLVIVSFFGILFGFLVGMLEDIEFEDESVLVWEVGFKLDWEIVCLNVVVFYGVYDNL